MRQVKIFKATEADVASLEAEVNAWIRSAGARVVSVTGNIAPQGSARPGTERGLGGGGFTPSDVILIVLYESGS